MKLQFQETKEFYIKELEVAKMVAESVPVLQEVPVIDHELVNKLTAENEKLKSLVISLENKIDETGKRFEETSKISEERLKQNLEAESKIIQLKTAMQRLEEKLSDIEIEDHILQQQALINSPTGKISGNLVQTIQPVENSIHAVGFLVIHQKSRITYDDLTTDLCPILSVQQFYRICTLYWDDNYNTRSVSPDVISSMKIQMTEESNEADSNSSLLDDISSIPFSADDISNCLQDSDFRGVKPAAELLENPAFEFLQ